MKFWCRLLITIMVSSQCPAQTLPFFLQLEQVDAPDLPAIHSFAKAQSGSKWLVAAGRVDGLHSLFPGQSFQPNMENDQIFVIDTNGFQLWSSSVYNLPYQIRQSLRATNTEYFQRGNYLYIIGGFGYDSINDYRRTYGTLTALDVDGLINEIVSGGNNLTSYIRQVSDTVFAVTGGKLEMLGGKFYLIGGQYFDGLYTKQTSTSFTQRYTNSISSFDLDDDGVNITVSNFTSSVDTVNFHRRDLNAAPTILTDGEEGIGVYGGVFQYGHDIPYQQPVYISQGGIENDFSFEQKMSQYTCVNIPLYDSVQENMYTVFVAGISLYDYVDSSGSFQLDTLVPFINDINVLTRHKDKTSEETILPLLFPELGGANAEFFASPEVPVYSNGVIKLRELVTPTLLGYLYGGITSEAPNESNTDASSKVYRVILQPDFNSGVLSVQENHLRVFPNPADDYVNVVLKNMSEVAGATVCLTITDQMGKVLQRISSGDHQYIRISTRNLQAGYYYISLNTASQNSTTKLAVLR